MISLALLKQKNCQGDPIAKGKKTGGRNFVKGQSGNPKGRPKVDVRLRQFRVMTKNEVAPLVHRFWELWQLPSPEAQRLISSGSLKLIEECFLSCAVGVRNKQDVREFRALLETLFGPMFKETDGTVESAPMGIAPQININLTEEESTRAIRELRRIRALTEREVE